MFVAIASAACGSSAGRSVTASSTAGSAWVAGHLPNGFVIVSAEERAGHRTVGYAPEAERERISDFQIAITASTPATADRQQGRDARAVRVRGHDATLVTLTDEGTEYGHAVAWDERSDVRISVEGSNGPTEQDTLAVAEQVRSISETAWRTLLIELSPDTHVGRVDPHARPVEALRGTTHGSDYVLTALVPGGYPLGVDDHRLDCFHLSYRGQTTHDYCPGPQPWTRLSGQLFVFGSAPRSFSHVRITGIEGTRLDPITADTSRLSSGPPQAFYVAPLPEGTCAVSVDNADGPGTLGGTGPLQEAGTDYTRCTGLAPGQMPPGPTPIQRNP